MSPRVIHLHPQAPPKPAAGAACNGCGVCCAAEPCPVGRLAGGPREGACPLLRWSDDAQRYLCGAADESGAPRWRARLVQRWISAGSGCDCTLQAEAAA